MTTEERINQIIPRIEKTEFLKNQGLGNEIGFYVFDYPPEDEILVRDGVEMIRKHFDSSGTARILEINLFHIIIEILQKRKLLDKVMTEELKTAPEKMLKNLSPILKVETIVAALMEKVEDHDVVFLTGTGTAFPYVRSHDLLNNLHDKLDDRPLVLFFPGQYDMQSVRLFGLLKNNYYRAFKLVS